MLESQDGLWNEPQHHGWSPQRVEQVDADTHEGKCVGSVKFFFSQKTIDLLRRENFTQPAIEGDSITHRPVRGLNLTPRSVARRFPDAQMNIGMPFLVGQSDNLFEGWAGV